MLPGRVTLVSPDIAATPSGNQYYTIRAELEPEALRHFPEVRLFAGAAPGGCSTPGRGADALSSCSTQRIRQRRGRAFRD